MGPRIIAPGRGPGSPRLTGWRAVLLWIAIPVDIAMVVGAFALTRIADGVLLAAVLIAGTVASFGVVGALVVTRLPRNPIGWIVWMTAHVIAGSIFGSSYATLSITSYDGSLPATVPIAFAAQVDLIPLLGLVGIYLPMHFPDGHLPSIRWRNGARISFVAVAIASVLSAVSPGTLSGGSDIANPLGMAVLQGSEDIIGLLTGVALLGPFCLAVASVVIRYRAGGSIERQQLRWFAAAALVMVLFFALGSTNIGPMAEFGWLLIVVGLALMPIAIGVAVLRYRLYEIDRIISRTIGWAVVTATLLAVFGGAVLGLQALLADITQGQTLAVAASTLVAFALFQPLRRRVQSAVNRRFDRARVDADRTATAFADRLREQTDLRGVEADIAGTIESALRPSSTGVWIRGASR